MEGALEVQKDLYGISLRERHNCDGKDLRVIRNL